MRLADVRPVADLDLHEEYVELDITDLEAFTAACGGIDTVLHLAADPSPQADFYQSLLSLNIIGGYNGFEAARRAGCRCLVFASSINAVLGYGQDRQAASWEVPIYPQNVYGATKCWGEALARVYGQDHALSCIACVCTARPSTRAISPKTPRMEASAHGMRPICSLPVSMPMKRAASILSMAPRATKTTGPGQFVGSTLGLRATGRHGVPPDIILGIYWTPVRCRKSDNCTGPHRFTPEP